MITSSKRPGRPKGKNAPLTSKERYQRYTEKLKESGGKTVIYHIDGDENAALKQLRIDLKMPDDTSEVEVIRVMLIVLSGRTYISGRSDITATIDIKMRY
ncbi:hypothetical protein [Serratia proteamaculans]|uniref:hypothetical protein n=1 Tax=Serratia proteamaculans TaxID=28151 RepID=UPI003D03A2B3